MMLRFPGAPTSPWTPAVRVCTLALALLVALSAPAVAAAEGVVCAWGLEHSGHGAGHSAGHGAGHDAAPGAITGGAEAAHAAHTLHAAHTSDTAHPAQAGPHAPDPHAAHAHHAAHAPPDAPPASELHAAGHGDSAPHTCVCPHPCGPCAAPLATPARDGRTLVILSHPPVVVVPARDILTPLPTHPRVSRLGRDPPTPSFAR